MSHISGLTAGTIEPAKSIIRAAKLLLSERGSSTARAGLAKTIADLAQQIERHEKSGPTRIPAPPCPDSLADMEDGQKRAV